MARNKDSMLTSKDLGPCPKNSLTMQFGKPKGMKWRCPCCGNNLQDEEQYWKPTVEHGTVCHMCFADKSYLITQEDVIIEIENPTI